MRIEFSVLILALGLGACDSEKDGRTGPCGLRSMDACAAGEFCSLGECVAARVLQSESIPGARDLDLLLVIDNSGSMWDDQLRLAQALPSLLDPLEERLGPGRWQLAVITTGMESIGCPPCTEIVTAACLNETGENGRFQSRVGRITDTTTDPPTYEFGPPDPNCRIVTSANRECLYDPATQSGTLLVGTTGCGYEHGLEPIRVALEDLAGTTSAGFLRDGAVLAVLVLTDEEDCGRVGEVTEGLSGIGSRVCYYAAKGQGPDGTVVDPQAGLPYQLTPVQEYFDFLSDLKGNREGMVRFGAIVGVEDPAAPAATEIRYESSEPSAAPLAACRRPACSLDDPTCEAFPGTRYLELAEMFGLGEGGNGSVYSICQNDLNPSLAEFAEDLIAPCREAIALADPVAEPARLGLATGWGWVIPRSSCGDWSDDVAYLLEEQPCLSDADCNGKACKPWWDFEPPADPPDPAAPHGRIRLLDPYLSCPLGADMDLQVVELPAP
ncbi:MAG TPA: hypothetical protein PK668_10275 [Myxococcota bacterium]|nr:hypothetical protein [Myxococcota bacterium]HRY93447.1 hypothetical protein [Myxococcota bacterium]HSA22120.1 hypothetical protein [Myxococcota bacterium]